MTTGTSSMALPGSALEAPLLDEIGVVVLDAASGALEAPVRDWSRNSLGSMQGGAVAAVIEAAADAAWRAEGSDVVVTDLQLTYLALARVGPIRTRVDVLDARPDVVTTHVELVDAGSDGRVTTVGRVVATRSLRPDPPA
jgi:acyl-coenzyme A thioesterase PaaI-like protein